MVCKMLYLLSKYIVMKRQIFFLFLLSYLFLVDNSNAQEINNSDKSDRETELFKSEQILYIKLSYSNKELKKDTNDSTYLKTDLSYKSEDGTWKTIAVEIRARGNYRRAKCDFPPVKLKIKKSVAKGTVFEGNKKLKMVLPCLEVKNINDDLVKEFIAYKLYEVISPYHFKTRMISLDLTEVTGKKTMRYVLSGFLIESDKNLAKRFHGKELERFTHQVHLDTITSVQNAFFQFMIANTDYSTAYQHNEKLFLINGKIIPVPYDFDMCGFVDPRYAVVSEVQNEKLPIADVTERLYRGFKREPEVFQQVRKQYLDNESKMLEVVDSYETLFSDPKEFAKARDFILGFYEVMTNDKKFNREIVDRARTK